MANYSQAVDYFRDNNLNFYLTQDEFYFTDNGCIRPILDFCVDSPEDLNPQYWKRYIFIWPIGVMHYNIDAKPPRKRLVKPPSEAVSEVISESPETSWFLKFIWMNLMKKMFFKLGKDEISNCKPNLVEIFFRRKRFLPKLRR